MRVGLIARANDRGLGIQTWEFFRHMQPHQVAVVDLGESEGFPQFFDRYPGAAIWKHRGRLGPNAVRRFLRQVDVVYTAETTYDPIVAKVAAELGVRVVVHVNPEFHNEGHRASKWWAPTCWRLPHLPAGTEVVPVPVATDRFDPVAEHRGPCRWLHVAGKAAMWDRNGTQALLDALPLIRRRCSLTIAAQDARTFQVPTHSPQVDVRVVGPTDDYWRLYDDHDALVLPRRYGGLCLPTQEAMAAGLAVAMTDLEPNPQTWPVHLIDAHRGKRQAMPGGSIRVAHVDPPAVARAMDVFADPDVRHEHQARARQWATDHSWDVWADRYRELLCG